MAAKAKKNVYEIITERIIEKMKQGIIPWQKPWGVCGPAKNLVSDKPYRGINTFLLGSAGFSSSYWATFKQISDKGGKIKKGAKSEIVVFWKKDDAKDKGSTEGEVLVDGGTSRFVLRYYRVFNLSQVEGIKTGEELKTIDFVPNQSAEMIVEGFKGCPLIKHEENRAYYAPDKDVINMPEKHHFHSVGEYYSTLFHEMTHSTGHQRRLNRDGFKDGDRVQFGSDSYSKEELIAEIGSSFLCANAGIDDVFNNSVGYIQGWIKRFKDHPKMIVLASGAAQKATDHILGCQSEQ